MVWQKAPDIKIEDNRPGLEVKFKEGESLPWKGIWMLIDKVHKDRLELIPTSMTWKMHKRINK